jgi:hypothetical protein
MSEQSKDREDAGSIWRGQPEENVQVSLQQIAERRTDELSASSRAEILMSICAALLLVSIGAWRLQIAHEGLLELGFAATIGWAALSLYWFRRRIWRRGAARSDAVAASGLEYYRGELERRRDHLRNAWLWHGPQFLALIILVAILTGRRNITFQPLRNVLPLLVPAGLWIGYGIWRRRLQANELQREIDELRRAGGLILP